MKLLIDCDYIVYKCCAATQTEIDFGEDLIVVTSNFTDAYNCVKRELEKIQRDLGGFDDLILFFTSPNNFRKKIFWDNTCWLERFDKWNYRKYNYEI